MPNAVIYYCIAERKMYRKNGKIGFEENSYSTAVDPVRGLLFDLSILSTFSKQ